MASGTPTRTAVTEATDGVASPVGEAAQKIAQKQAERENFANKLGKRHAKALMIAAGLRPGPNVSLQLAIDTFKQRQFRDIVVYAVFLFSFTVASYTQRDVHSGSLYKNSVRDVILNRPFVTVPFYKSFGNISVHEDVWSYLETVMPEYLWQESWYNGEQFDLGEKASVLRVNLLVQAPRIRQVRVQPYKCADGPGGSIQSSFVSLPKRLEQYLVTCYPSAGGAKWDHAEELPGWSFEGKPNATLKYQSAEELRSEYYSTQYEVYEGGGFAIDIPLTTSQTEVKAMLKHLRESRSVPIAACVCSVHHQLSCFQLSLFAYLTDVLADRWTDLKTRALFFDFVTYHPYEAFYLSVRLTFEFLHIGQVVPTDSFRVMRLGFYATEQYVAMFFDGITYLCLIRLMYDDLVRVLTMPRYFFRDLWNYLSMAMYFVFGISTIFKARFWLRSLPYVNGPPHPQDMKEATLDFEALGWIYNQIWNWTALNSVLVWGRAFRFLRYADDSVAHLSYTIFNSAHPLMAFFVVFALINFGYGVSFHIAFGVDHGGNIRGVTGGAGTLPSAIFTQWRMLLKGDNNFDAITEANRLLGPLLLFTYAAVCIFIAIKLPSVILNKTYRVVCELGTDDPMAKEFRKVLVRNTRRFIQKHFWRGKKDDDELFRLERERQYEEAYHTKPKIPKDLRRINGRTMEDIELINTNFYAIEKIIKEFARNAKVMNVKVEEFCRIELEKHAKEEAAKYVEPPSTLLFGRKEAWGESTGGYQNKPDLSSCIQMLGNKTILPPNWKLYHSEEGEPFYFNILDDTVQWDPPMVLKAAAVPEIEEDEEETPVKKKKKKKKKKVT